MSCLNPQYRKNPKYRPNKSNGGVPPVCPDPRLMLLRYDCGKCYECRRKRASHWRFRLLQEYKYSPTKRFHFVTFTFSEDSLFSLRSEFPDLDDNCIAKVAVRRFLERYRKRYGVSLRHFLVTELGGKNGRIHLHGIVMDCKAGRYRGSKYIIDMDLFHSIWRYGYCFFGWCNERSISYVTKYIMKPDPYHPTFRPKLLLSPGIGSDYFRDLSVLRFHRSSSDGVWYCVSSTGHKLSMPRYYRDKIFSEDERLRHSLDLLDNPPPFVFRGREFSSFWSFHRAVYAFYDYTLNLGVSDALCAFRDNLYPDESFDLFDPLIESWSQIRIFNDYLCPQVLGY
ncbi:replication initiation protein [Tortoise microvirus 22]|nr:replication initiation protein [Tortoise microvirus 22]